jgi:hypothetical protein
MKRLAPLLVLLAAMAAPSAAGAQVSVFDVSTGDQSLTFVEAPLHVTGAVSVDFHGDQAAGCEAARLCGVSGTVTWNPSGPGTLLAFGFRDADGTHAEQGYLSFGDQRGDTSPRPTVYSRVQRGDALCADVGSTDSAAFGSGPTPGRSLEIGLLTSQGIGLAAVQALRTRCAGPLAADVAGLLPTRVISERALLHHTNKLDFSAERTFSAHGLTGTVHSTVVFHLGRGAGADNQSDQSFPGPTRVVRRRSLEVRYRVEQVSGQVVTGLRGLADPDLCGPLDSCGLAGSVTVAPRASAGDADVFVEAPARHPWSDLRRAAGLAPGAVPRGVRTYGYVSWPNDHGTTASDLARYGAPDCADSEPLLGGSVALRFSSGLVHAVYGDTEEPGAELLATRCPGPGLNDVAPAGALATTTVPLRTFGARRVTLRIAHGHTYASDGYRGSVSPDVTLVLRRTKIKRRVQSFRVPEEFAGVFRRGAP